MVTKAKRMTASPDAQSADAVEPPRSEGEVQVDGQVALVLAALADPTRRQLLDDLLQTGRASATTLSGRLPVSRQAVVKHLQNLEAAGLVEGVRAGREVLYAPRAGPLNESARWFADLAAKWDRRLENIKRAAETVTDH